MTPTHGEHLAIQKGHHVISAAFHERLSKTHAAIARHLETTDPKLSKHHAALSECHKDFSAHHLERSKCFGDGVEAKVSEADEITRLYKVLSD
jgi:hypothetical protein